MGSKFWRAWVLTAVATATWLAAVALTPAVAADFDTSGLPKPPTTFEEQKLWDSIETARQYPDLAADTHHKLADYYDRKGLSALAAKERAAAGGGSSTAAASPSATTTGSQPAPTDPEPTPAAPPGSSDTEAPGQPNPAAEPSTEQATSPDDQLDPTVFDLSAFPAQPTDFEEQLIQESLRDPNTLTDPVLLAFAHRQLGRYYAARGRADLAGTEYARAIVAVPEDHRGYSGLAALHEAVGVEAGDGNVALRDVAQRLQEQGLTPEGGDEPEPQVAANEDPGQWQEVSAEFNRRMNYLYTSNAWNNVYRTVFTNLYSR